MSEGNDFLSSIDTILFLRFLLTNPEGTLGFGPNMLGALRPFVVDRPPSSGVAVLGSVSVSERSLGRDCERRLHAEPVLNGLVARHLHAACYACKTFACVL